MPDAYPTGQDLASFITGLSFLPSDTAAAILATVGPVGKAAAAVAEWETRTGWKPFLAASADTTRTFDPPGKFPGRASRGGRVLELGAGLLSATEVRTQVTFDFAGVVQTEGRDYRLGPYNNPAEGLPYEYIEFGFGGGLPWDAIASPGRAPKSISVTGKFGYAATLPDDVWEALRGYAARLSLVEGGVPLTGVGEEVSIGDFSVNTASGVSVWGQSSPLAVWKVNFDAAVRRYQRIEM